MKIPITFGDIIHREHTAKVTPLGISMIAAYAYKKFKDQIKIDIFKSADKLINHVEKEMPKIACFTNYIWTENISYQIAKRLKKKDPNTIIVFGGPNYSLNESHKQKQYLQSHPDIDFYIIGEGEQPFVQLLDLCFKYNFNGKKIKEEKIKISGCHYLIDDEFVSSPMPLPIKNLDDIPSPYLLGFLDKFLKGSDRMKALMQTTRGCPFSCTFCTEGNDYHNKVRRFSPERARAEIQYLARNAEFKVLAMADSNFGMYKQDLEICREIASTMKSHNWPQGFEGMGGKNKKERVLEATNIIGHTYISAAIQSTDEKVLKEVKRNNVSGQTMLDMVRDAKKKSDATSFSELILGLPGDSKEGHMKSNMELLDSEVDVVRSHQFIMLPSSPASTDAERTKHGLVTKFRVVPKTVEEYEMFGEKFYAPEIDEICVASKTLHFEDYLECRSFNLTVEIFYNNAVFEDLVKLLKKKGLKVSLFIEGIHNEVKKSNKLLGLYDNYLKETKELYNSREEVEEILRNKEILRKYISTEMGNNEQLVYKSIGILEMMEEVHKVAFTVAKKMLAPKMKLNGELNKFFSEFEAFSLLQKNDMFSTDKINKKIFHYDFIKLFKSNFEKDVAEVYDPKGINFEFMHSQQQKEVINDYFNIYGDSKNGLAYMLGIPYKKNLNRKANYAITV